MGGLCQRHLHMAPRVSIYAGPTYCHPQRLACDIHCVRIVQLWAGRQGSNPI